MSTFYAVLEHQPFRSRQGQLPRFIIELYPISDRLGCILHPPGAPIGQDLKQRAKQLEELRDACRHLRVGAAFLQLFLSCLVFSEETAGALSERASALIGEWAPRDSEASIDESPSSTNA